MLRNHSAYTPCMQIEISSSTLINIGNLPASNNGFPASKKVSISIQCPMWHRGTSGIALLSPNVGTRVGWVFPLALHIIIR